jgi:hypothetical protein
MAIVTRVVTRFEMADGVVEVLIAEDDVSGDMQGFRFTNTTGSPGVFSAMRADRSKWRDRATIRGGSSRMNVPPEITSEDQLDYWTSLPGATWR